MFVSEVGCLVREARALLTSCRPEDIGAPDAAELARLFVELEKVGAAGKALFARRVEETGAYRDVGHRDAGDWLASVAGEPKGRALDVLQTARQLDDLPAVKDAFVAGHLSGAQVKEVAGAAAVRPEAADALLEVARTDTFKRLRQEADRARWASLRQEEAAARDARAHTGRHLRVWSSPRGGVEGTFSLTDADWGRCAARLEARAQRIFDSARAAGNHEGHAQYLADALVDLVLGARAEPGGGPGARVLVRVDATALRRGYLADGEQCEIAGVGTVSVDTARQLMDDSLLNVLVTDGHDVLTVTSTTRTVPTAVRIALLQRDPVCVVPGCDAALGLQIDHWRTDYARGGLTSIDNLARVCKVHHDMHTYGAWRLRGGPGRWRWVPSGPAPPPGRSARAFVQGVDEKAKSPVMDAVEAKGHARQLEEVAAGPLRR